MEPVNPTHERLLRQFGYEHLPDGLRKAAMPFAKLAEAMVEQSQERDLHPADVTVALKDAFVRSHLN